MRKKTLNRQELSNCFEQKFTCHNSKNDSLRIFVSQKVFNKRLIWLILSKNFLGLGMAFVYEKMAAL